MFEWIRAWWKADRIRHLPGQSRLLQWAVGSRVLVRDRVWRVTERADTVSDDEVCVVFRLLEMGAVEPVTADLHFRVSIAALSRPSVFWIGADWQDELLEEDIVTMHSVD